MVLFKDWLKNQIKEYSEKTGKELTQKELAGKTVSQNTISAIMSGKKEPSKYTIGVMEGFFNAKYDPDGATSREITAEAIIGAIDLLLDAFGKTYDEEEQRYHFNAEQDKNVQGYISSRNAIERTRNIVGEDVYNVAMAQLHKNTSGGRYVKAPTGQVFLLQGNEYAVPENILNYEAGVFEYNENHYMVAERNDVCGVKELEMRALPQDDRINKCSDAGIKDKLPF